MHDFVVWSELIDDYSCVRSIMLQYSLSSAVIIVEQHVFVMTFSDHGYSCKEYLQRAFVMNISHNSIIQFV